MIFENPFKYRRKGDRRKKRYRILKGILMLSGIFFLTTIISGYLTATPPIDLANYNAGDISSAKIYQKTQKKERDATDTDPLSQIDFIPSKNPEQEAIDKRIQGIEKLPPISGKAFLHTAFVSQNNPLDIQNMESHTKQLDIVFPDWLNLSGSDCQVQESIDWNVFEILQKNKVSVFPRFSDISNAGQMVDFPDLIKDENQSRCLIDSLKWHIKNRSVAGINIDIGNIGISYRDSYTRWILSLTESFHSDHLFVTVTVPINNAAFDYENIGRIADMVIVKAYDEHSLGGKPGPVAGIYWFEKSLDALAKRIPPSKTVIAMGLHGYDWNLNTDAAPEQRDFHKTLRLAGNIKTVILWDRSSLNNTFSYTANDGSSHEVWFLDAISAWNQYLLAKQKKFHGISLSYDEDEDASVWKFLYPGSLDSVSIGGEYVGGEAKNLYPYTMALLWTGSWDVRLGKFSPSDPSGGFDLKTLENVPYDNDTITHGTGKMYKVLSLQQTGTRELSFSGEMIVGSKYVRLPQSLTVSRFGNGKPKTVALTFYDGTDKEYSEQILDILKIYGVRATFFPTALQTKQYPEIINREYADGHLLGNGIYWREDTEEQSKQKLNDAKRLLQKVSGHSALLVRAPYDMEAAAPFTQNQTRTLYSMGNMGYALIGSDIDSGDLSDPGVESIVNTIVSRVKNNDSNIVVMHDGPGNRTQTVQALAKLIPTLQSEGYRFVTIDEMLDVPKESLMPTVSYGEQFSLFWSGFLPKFKEWALYFLLWLFIITTVVSIFRIIFMGILIFHSHAFQKKYFPRKFLHMPPVTILVPAYNEEKVIERTIIGLLSSEYPKFEILVIDDGSTDKTAECVRKLMEIHQSIRLVSKKNEGKSLALNIGFKEAKYDYIITVDADTIVMPKTVYYLMEPFADSKVDAVCGNIGVGNVKNVLTAFQEIEYVTGQNYDRHAFDALNCISVVPGATGAWKKRRVLEIGGYSSDTLVEDADLTLTLLENGGRIVYAPLAKSITEAPEKVEPLFKQRFRWSYGTFQCFWKHRRTFGKGTLGLIALPNMILFQVIFPLLCPIGDVVLLAAVFFGNFQPIFIGYILFFFMDAVVSGTAYALDKKSLSHIWAILVQRFFYRQFMYFVTFRSIIAAFSGSHHGWNKLERKGTVEVTEVG